MDRALAWSNMIKSVSTLHEKEKEEIKESNYERMGTGVYRSNKYNKVYYQAWGFPGKQRKISLYYGHSLEDALKARVDWELGGRKDRED